MHREPSMRVVIPSRLVLFDSDAEAFRGLAHPLSSERPEAIFRTASAFGSTKRRRGGVRTHPGLPEMLIILCSFFTIELSLVDFRVSGSPLTDLRSEFVQRLSGPLSLQQVALRSNDGLSSPLIGRFPERSARRARMERNQQREMRPRQSAEQ
jgi:hypothetical protein